LPASSLSLPRLQHYPEGRAIQKSIYRYLNSELFEPTQSVAIQVIKYLIGNVEMDF
jgi:hypothetical protein